MATIERKQSIRVKKSGVVIEEKKMTAVITTKARKYQESVGKFRQNRLF